jgi:nucleoid DNA-binding protein
MPKKILAQALVENAGYSRYRAGKLVDIVIGLLKRGLGDGKSVELGRLGLLEVVTRESSRKITRNLKHVGPTIITVNKQRKSIKLRSKLDLSTEEEQIVNRAAISACRLPDQDNRKTPTAQLSRPTAVASVRWRGRAYKVPSRTEQFKNK